MLAWLRMIGWAVFGGAFFFFMRRSRLMRILAGVMRRWRPIWRGPFASFAGATYMVTRADDVQEVFRRTNDFLLGPVNERKILSGDFVISLDPERRYWGEKSIILDSLPPARLQQLEQIVDAAAAQLLQPPLRNPLNVAEFAEFVTVAITEQFWGLDAAGARSAVVHARPGADTMRLWLRKLACVLGSIEPAPFGIREAGVLCSEEFVSYVRAACATHSGRRDMIWHILQHSGNDLELTARNIAALVMTGVPVVTKGFCHAFQELLRRPAPLRAAILAAQAGQRERVGRLLIEALRFNPVFPVLPRYCVRPTTLAAGTPRATEIPAGSNVIASPLGAMFDPEALEDPEAFSDERNLQINPASITPGWEYGSPPDGTPGHYLLFGGGDHWCLGEQMAIAEMASMAVALLNRLPNPRIERRLRYDGSAAASLLVRHGP
jgi:cytochrome P450